MSANRIDPTPVRISTNVSVSRQTPKTDFGDRVNAGLNNAAGAVGSGLSAIAPLVPGGPILSAAVSSMGNVTNGGASAGQTVNAQYSTGAMGVTSLGGSSSPINTTVAVGEPNPAGTGMGAGIGGVGTGAAANLPISQAGVGLAGTSSIQDMAAQQARLLNVQIAMQNESQVFSTVSNVLKVRHDTVKNTIQNVH
jgi:hypothetical protein